jgi:hypothetical protein
VRFPLLGAGPHPCEAEIFATYFGGTDPEILEGLAIAPDAAVWATGLTSSHGLGTPDHHGGRSDAILVRLTVDGK